MGKFLKKPWCCVGEGIPRQIGFINWVDEANWPWRANARNVSFINSLRAPPDFATPWLPPTPPLENPSDMYVSVTSTTSH